MQRGTKKVSKALPAFIVHRVNGTNSQPYVYAIRPALHYHQQWKINLLEVKRRNGKTASCNWCDKQRRNGEEKNTRITVNWFIVRNTFFLSEFHCRTLKLYVLPSWLSSTFRCTTTEIYFYNRHEKCQMPPYNTIYNAFHNSRGVRARRANKNFVLRNNNSRDWETSQDFTTHKTDSTWFVISKSRYFFLQASRSDTINFHFEASLSCQLIKSPLKSTFSARFREDRNV